MTNGMKQEEYENRIRALAFMFLAAPVVILLGMIVTGAIIDSVLHTSNTFAYLFSAIGGIPALGFYYYREWKKFVNRELPKNEILENQKKILEILSEIREKLKPTDRDRQ